MRNRIEAVLRVALMDAENKEGRARDNFRSLPPGVIDMKTLDELSAASQELRDSIQWVQQVEDKDGTRQTELIAENARLKRAMCEIQNRRGKIRVSSRQVSDVERDALIQGESPQIVFIDEAPQGEEWENIP